MRYIINESQLRSMDYEVMSDVLYKILNIMYPNNWDEYIEGINKTNIISDDGDLLFYYEWDREYLVFMVDVLMNIYKVTGFPLFGDDYIENDEYGEFLKVFAKRHYGFNVKNVYLGRQ